MPIKLMDSHEILDEPECVSCGAPSGRVIYFKPDTFYWEFAEETVDEWFPGCYKQEGDIPARHGFKKQTAFVENGLCRRCNRLEASIRYRGVWGWKAFLRRKDGTTYTVPHASEYARAKAMNKQEKYGCQEKPEW